MWGASSSSASPCGALTLPANVTILQPSRPLTHVRFSVAAARSIPIPIVGVSAFTWGVEPLVAQHTGRGGYHANSSLVSAIHHVFGCVRSRAFGVRDANRRRAVGGVR